MQPEKVCVLVVDDDAAGLYAKSRMLQRADFEVLQALTGTDALRLVREKRPQLIVLDIQLPDMNGLEICETIKADPELHFIPVLQTSATFTNAADAAAGLNRGADAYLTEPLKEDVLIATVNALLRARRAEDELRKHREWLQVTLRSIGDGVIATDVNGCVMFMNPVAETLSGWTNAEALSRDISEVLNLVSEVTREKISLPIAQILKEQGSRRTMSGFVLISKDGTEYPVEESAAPIEDIPGRATGMVLVLREIGERKRTEKRLLQLLVSEEKSRREAEAANQAKDEFLGVVSHELRTPLTAMLGWSKLLKSGTLNRETTANAIEVIERNVKSQAQIIEDLLDISRIIAGKLTLDLGEIDLKNMIQNSIESIKAVASAKGIAIRTNLVPVRYLGDESRLQQVIWNLMTNAIKFTPEGGAIDVDLSSNESVITIKVTDTGIGIDPQFIPQVFERFSQHDSTASRKTGGLGIGLSIVQTLVQLHHGDVAAFSDGIGKGSTFTLTLPMPDPQEFIVRKRDSKRNTADDRLDGMHILIVEDDPDSRDMITLLLTTAGATVTSASTAEEGMSLLQKRRPNVIVSDIGLPGEDGYSFIRRVRNFEKSMGGSIPALALTAYAKPETRWQALDAGFQLYASKPVETSQLLKSIAKLGGRTRSQ